MIFKEMIAITTAILISCFLLISAIITTESHQTFARCPNGTHKSPSGDCESVVKSATKLPRCPNGTHRSPSGDCESVASSTSVSPSQSFSKDNEGKTSSEETSTTNPSQGENNNDNDNPSLPSTTAATSTTTSSSGEQCDQSLWNHVYNPSRLQVVESCKTISGIIESKRAEADGDYHIRLKLDPQFSDLINSANVNGQYGDLVLEPICVNPVTQPDAISACQDFHQNISIPPIGTHVQVTGSYVLDSQHGGWAEIHPITSISEIP